MLLEAGNIAVLIPEKVYQQYYADKPNIHLINDLKDLKSEQYAAAVVYNAENTLDFIV
jgi:hypothetical protein